MKKRRNLCKAICEFEQAIQRSSEERVRAEGVGNNQGAAATMVLPLVRQVAPQPPTLSATFGMDENDEYQTVLNSDNYYFMPSPPMNRQSISIPRQTTGGDGNVVVDTEIFATPPNSALPDQTGSNSATSPTVEWRPQIDQFNFEVDQVDSIRTEVHPPHEQGRSGSGRGWENGGRLQPTRTVRFWELKKEASASLPIVNDIASRRPNTLPPRIQRQNLGSRGGQPLRLEEHASTFAVAVGDITSVRVRATNTGSIGQIFDDKGQKNQFYGARGWNTSDFNGILQLDTVFTDGMRSSSMRPENSDEERTFERTDYEDEAIVGECYIHKVEGCSNAFHCEVCKTTMTGQIPTDMHLRGGPHRKKVRMHEELEYKRLKREERALLNSCH